MPSEEEDSLAVRCMEMSRAVWRRTSMPRTVPVERTSSGGSSYGNLAAAVGSLPSQGSAASGGAFHTGVTTVPVPPTGPPPGVTSPRAPGRRASASSLGSGGWADTFAAAGRPSTGMESFTGGEWPLSGSRNVRSTSLPLSALVTTQRSSSSKTGKTWASKLLSAIGLGGKKRETDSFGRTSEVSMSRSRASMSAAGGSAGGASPPRPSMVARRRASLPTRIEEDVTPTARSNMRLQRVTSLGMFSRGDGGKFGKAAAAAAAGAAADDEPPGSPLTAEALAAISAASAGDDDDDANPVEKWVPPPPAEPVNKWAHPGWAAGTRSSADVDDDIPGGRPPIKPYGFQMGASRVPGGQPPGGNGVGSNRGSAGRPTGRPDGGDESTDGPAVPSAPRRRTSFVGRQAQIKASNNSALSADNIEPPA